MESAVPSGYAATIICLANSRKLSGRCVAGKMVSTNKFGEWIRPVSSRPEKELSAFDRHYEGTAQLEPALLDIIEIDFLGKDPHPYQPENHLIDDKVYWGLARRANFSEALQVVDPIQPSLWGLSSEVAGQIRTGR
jgi:putative nucleic acid modification protein with dual OB domain